MQRSATKPWPACASSPRGVATDPGADAVRARVMTFCSAAVELADKRVGIAPDPHMLSTEVQARLMLAQQQLAADNVAGAEHQCQVALWLHPDCVAAFLGLANVLMQKARFVASQRSIAHCKPSDGCQRGAQGDVSGAHALYSHALRLHPGSAAAWCGLAAAAAASGRSASTVESLFREAARVEPGAAHAYIGLASCAKEAGQLDAAEAHFQTAIRLRPGDARLHAFLAGMLYEQGRLEEAVCVYNSALQLEPTFVEVVNDLGNAYRGLGRLEEARHCYMTCLSQHAAAGNTATPAVAIAYCNLGAVSKLLGKNEEAISCFDIVARLQPSNADAHAALGGSLKDAGHHELALAAYRNALAIAPQHATRAHFVHSLASVCAWDEFPGALACLIAEARDVLAQGQPCAVQPFHAVR
jgi:tetratricopeptide (TPR) repeat protein